MNSYVGGYVNAGGQTPTVGPVSDPGTWVGGQLSGPPGSINLPPPPPAGTPVWGYYKALNRWENYMVDTNSPPQHLQFNGLIDLPFGRGKRWLSGVNKPLNEVVGGWQIAGDGAVANQDFYPITTNWGPTAASGKTAASLHVYKKGAPITDCRSGICVKSYEWFNGYIAPTAISGNACAAGLSNVVQGLPGGWTSDAQPMDNLCGTPVNGKAVVGKYSGDNDVNISGVPSQNGGAATEVPYGDVPANNDNGASEAGIDVTNPLGHTVLDGPWNWTADASLFKLFPITERAYLRLNVDAFNVFNHQNLPNPNTTDGTVCYSAGGVGCSSSSFNVPRQIQLTLRLSF
jgi:hypothetical protein